MAALYLPQAVFGRSKQIKTKTRNRLIQSTPSNPEHPRDHDEVETACHYIKKFH